MRLHHLRVTAFGPFAETVEVDLDALGAAGLFLINGPTGSGKTSLLDAVCFALYGDVPGSRPKGSLHSDHASPEVAPSVELEWSVGGRRFRVVRSAEFWRPKKRGEGLVKEQHKVVLTELVDGHWVDRGSGRADEVGSVVREVVGLDLKQFATIVLLPQGEFARFLRSSSDDRAAILQRLFDTGRFEQVQRWLEGRRRDAEAAVAGGRRELQSLLTRVDDAAGQALGAAGRPSGDEDPGEDGDQTARRPVDVEETDAAVLRPALAELADQVEQVTVDAEHEAAQADVALRDASRRDESGRQIAALRRKAAAAEATVAALDARSALVAEARERHAGAVAAAAVLPYVEAAARRDAQARGAEEDQARAVAALPHALASALGLPSRTLSEDALMTARSEVSAAGDAVGRLADRLDRASRTVGELSVATDAVTTRLAEVATAGDRLEQATTALATLSERATALAAAAADAPAAQARVAALDGIVRQIRRVAAGDREVEAARRQVETATAARDARQHEVADLLRRRSAGLAAELALGLEEETPCPVCGSTTHPAPAAGSSDDLVSRELVEEAESRLHDAAETRTQALSALGAARATREALDRELEERLDQHAVDETADVADLLADANHAHEQAVAAADELDSVSGQVAAAEAHVQALERGSQAAQESLADARARVDLTRSRAVEERAAVRRALDEVAEARVLGLEGLSSAVDAHRSAGPDRTAELPDRSVVSAATAAVSVAEAALDRVHRARERVVTATAESTEAHRELAASLAGSIFADPEQVRRAHLAEPERRALDRSIKEHDRALADAHVVLDDPDVVAAGQGDDPDLAALAATLDASRVTAHRSAARAAVARQALDQLRGRLGEIDRLLDRLGPQVQQARTIREVADAVAGTGANNLKKMSLPTFVLAARLEEVVQLANERLRVMTDGRYELQHSDERAAHGARSGLGLQVIDGWSGKARDTSTLSGGETFMASLALALGLGDAVRAESGGIDLDTLFVDEGFGTLDEAALDQVMDVLDGLREGGRSVGIISHVTELRQRIPAQVRLTRTPRGSTLEVVSEPELL